MFINLVNELVDDIVNRDTFGRQAKPRGKTWNFEDNLPAKDITSQDTPQN